jgi:single-strand DNA-binding protein
MSSYELKGKIKAIFPTEQKTDTFKTRDFVVETEGDYPQMVKFQINQDKCNILDNFKEGQEVEVSFNLRGREWNGKYFTNLEAWKVFGVQNEDSPQPQKEKVNGFGVVVVEENDNLDLPF